MGQKLPDKRQRSRMCSTTMSVLSDHRSQVSVCSKHRTMNVFSNHNPLTHYWKCLYLTRSLVGFACLFKPSFKVSIAPCTMFSAMAKPAMHFSYPLRIQSVWMAVAADFASAQQRQGRDVMSHTMLQSQILTKIVLLSYHDYSSGPVLHRLSLTTWHQSYQPDSSQAI